MRDKVEGKVIPASFQKIEEWGTLIGVKDWREGQIEESVGDQNPGAEALPRSRKRQEEGAKEMSGEEQLPELLREEVTSDEPTEYFLPTEVRSIS